MRHGYFDTERDEYVIDRVDTPASWTNYLGVNDYCAILNQTGGGYSFYRSAERGRVTRFRANGLPQDYPGHWLYLRDDDDGDYWSATWQPIGKPLDQARHRVRHGLSYSVFECRYADIEVSQRVLVPLGDPVELWDVTVTNRSERPRRLSLFGYVEFSFHSIQIDNQNLQMSLYAAGSSQAAGVIEYDFHYEPWTYHYFAGPPNLAGFDCRREAFVGDYRSEANPVAVERGACSGSAGTTGNHCGGLQHRVELASGESRRLVYLLGHGDRAAGITARAKYTPEGVDQAAAQLRAYWADKQSRLKVATPSWAMTALTNAWTLLQLETCVVWSRFASFVEVGGRTGLGYRDTAQDAMAAAHSHPDKVRQRLWELLRGQMSAGYGLHLFDPLLFQENRRPEAPAGVRLPTVLPESAADQLHGLQDACSDDHLWLVGAVVAYLKETGDLAFLDQVVPFADSDPEGDSGSKAGLAAGAGSGSNADLETATAAETDSGADRSPATVYQHLKRAVDFTDQHVGPHGLAQGLRADWNDCLNLGGGETALVSFLHVWAARLLAETAAAIGRTDDAAHYTAMAERVAAVAERELWDGDWYLRGYTRDGVKIGSASSPEGKIFLEHMGWAVMAQVATGDHGRRALDAVQQHLASPFGLHLNWPSYTQVDDAIGYCTRVYPGVKENGAIFCHPNAWPIIAETILGNGDRAAAYYEAMAPANANDTSERRRSEPYVYAQFLFGRDHPFHGRAENPWLTGTAGWMYQAVSQHILGLRPGFDGLTVDPCVPRDWPGFTVQRRWRGGTYLIEVANPAGVNASVAAATLDGQPLELVRDPLTGRPCARLPLSPGTHLVTITLGGQTAG